MDKHFQSNSNSNLNELFKIMNADQNKQKDEKNYENPEKKNNFSKNKSDKETNFDFIDQKEKVNLQLIEDFKPLIDDYEIVKYLGRGSYGIVAKVKFLFKKF